MTFTSHEFTESGFSDDQAAMLVRAFERADRASAQRFSLLQDAMNAGFVELRQEMQQQFTALGRVIESGFSAVHARLDGVDERLARVETRLDGIDSRLDRVLRQPPSTN